MPKTWTKKPAFSWVSRRLCLAWIRASYWHHRVISLKALRTKHTLSFISNIFKHKFIYWITEFFLWLTFGWMTIREKLGHARLMHLQKQSKWLFCFRSMQIHYRTWPTSLYCNMSATKQMNICKKKKRMRCMLTSLWRYPLLSRLLRCDKHARASHTRIDQLDLVYYPTDCIQHHPLGPLSTAYKLTNEICCLNVII